MEFGPVPVGQAEGAILAHSVMAGGAKLGKGRVLTAGDCAALTAAGWAEVTVARPGPGDLAEDAAALMLAEALAGDAGTAGLSLTRPHAGRVNLHATRPGVMDVDAAAIEALNALDPSVTVATLPPLMRVAAGQMLATVKIITYAVPGALVETAARRVRGAIGVRPVVLTSAGLILTETPDMPDKLIQKGRRAVAARLKALGIELAEVRVVPHATEAVAEALKVLPGDLALILTAAATSDARDTAPEAVRRAGGTVSRFGMPVDPGNLLFLGRLGDRPVIGLPGCARSLALNGADWVLERIACGMDVTDTDFARMGVGGLLKESPVRAQPRERES